jgi:hypothetical protein
MIDQLQIGNKYSYDDFEANVKERAIDSPNKKIIKDTVPFSNATYDFSKIDGELYWNERTLTYILEMDAMTPEELEEKKIAFNSWVMNVFQEELHDPFIEDYHFLATFEDIDFDDSEIEKTTITVTFSAYPFMMSNEKRVFTYNIPTNAEVDVQIENKSSHKITPTLTASVPVSFVYGGTQYSMNAGVMTSDSFRLAEGISTIKLEPATKSGTLRIEFVEEVF